MGPISSDRRGRLRDLYTTNTDRGRGGSKIPKIRLTSFVHGPKQVLFIGEANAKYNRDLYKCTFPTMISDWRQHWAKTSRTAPVFPFGFVQLSTSVGKGVEDIRWHQV